MATWAGLWLPGMGWAGHGHRMGWDGLVMSTWARLGWLWLPGLGSGYLGWPWLPGMSWDGHGHLEWDSLPVATWAGLWLPGMSCGYLGWDGLAMATYDGMGWPWLPGMSWTGHGYLD